MGPAPDERIRLVQGDITEQRVDAIVNAANDGLLPGGGVCGAIHRAGGPAIAEECARIGGCPTGSAVATGAGRLPARWVIHAVGPVWSGGDAGEDELLRSAYQEAVQEARRLGARSIAFPAISCGIFGFPLERAAKVAVEALSEGLAAGADMDEIRLVLFDEQTLAAFQQALGGGGRG